MLRATIATFALLAFPASGIAAGDRCKVTDPTGTPLNLRMDPNGYVMGTIRNGRVVRIGGQMTDTKGRAWVYIVDPRTTEPFGWVFREYISCF